MNDNEIIVIFKYESQPTEYCCKCKNNEKMKTVCLAFLSKKNLNIDSVIFLLNGKNIENSDYEKIVGQFVTDLNKNNLNILVYNKNDDNNPNPESTDRNLADKDQEAYAIFFYKSELTKIKCTMKSKILDVSRTFSQIKELNFDF